MIKRKHKEKVSQSSHCSMPASLLPVEQLHMGRSGQNVGEEIQAARGSKIT